MPRVLLDPGHYGDYNRSPAVPEYYESHMAWKLHLKKKAILESRYGIEVGVTRKDQRKDVPVYNRGLMARGYDGFFSDHSNAVGADVRDDVDRPVVIRLASDDAKGIAFAEKTAAMIAEVMGTRQKGVVNTRLQSNGAEYYGVLRGAKAAGCPHAYIIEHSFHTATAPARWLLDDKNLDVLAEREAALIAELLGVKSKEGEPMTHQEKIEFDALKARVKELEESKEKVYHYWKELPSWALRPLWAMHKAGFFSGESVGDLNASRSLVRTLVSNAAAFRKLGIISYSDGKPGETKDDILRELGIG